MKGLIAMSAVALLLTGVAAHAGHSHADLPDATQKPGSLFYGLERAQEAISMALTFDGERKAEKRLEYANERLAEARELSEQNESDRAELALRHYSRQMSRVSEVVDGLPSEKSQRIKTRVNETRGVRMTALQEVMRRTPKAAEKGLENAVEMPPVNPPDSSPGRQDSNGSAMPQETDNRRNPALSSRGYISTTTSGDGQ